MNVAALMDEIGTALSTVPGLRVHPFQAKRVTPPSALIGLPDSYTFDATYGRGSDRLSLPVLVVVGGVSDRASRDQLARYADGAGTHSVKSAIESGDYAEADTVVVSSVEFPGVRIADLDYLAASFTVDVLGPGGVMQ